MGRVGRTLIVAFGVLAVAQWLLATQVGLGRDAGFYLPLARDVLRGAVPIRDFAVFYPPGFAYVFAVLGERLLMSPVALKLLMLTLHSMATWLLYRVLRERNRPRREAVLSALLYHAWVISLDGKMIYLEPLQNLFLVAAWLALLRWPNRLGAAAAGLAAGLALMMKQYSLFLVPGMAWLALSGTGGATSRRERWQRGASFVALAPVAFLVFVVATRQDLMTVFRAISTVGGSVGTTLGFSRFAAAGPTLARIFDHTALTLLLPVAAATLWLILRGRSPYVLALAVTFAGSLAPLLVNQYPHYVQLVVPWAVLSFSEFTHLFGDQWVEDRARRQRFRERLVLIAALVLMPLFAKATLLDLHYARSEGESRVAHLAVARTVAAALPEHRDVLVINRPWLYILADLTPPNLDYRWPTSVGFEACNDLRDRSRFVVLAPFRGENPAAEGHRDVTAARDWLHAGGFERFAALPSPWGAPIELYRPAELSGGEGP